MDKLIEAAQGLIALGPPERAQDQLWSTWQKRVKAYNLLVAAASHAPESAPVSSAPECCPHKDKDHVLTAYRRYCKHCSCETKECSCKSWRGINDDCPMHREGRLKAQDEPTLAEKVHAAMTAGVKDVGVDHFYGKSSVAQDWRFMESETKLERCPFCGGTPHLQCDHKFFVLCLNCHCAVGERYDPDGWPAHEFSTAADAIAAWNTRVSSSSDVKGGNDGK